MMKWFFKKLVRPDGAHRSLLVPVGRLLAQLLQVAFMLLQSSFSVDSVESWMATVMHCCLTIRR